MNRFRNLTGAIALACSLGLAAVATAADPVSDHAAEPIDNPFDGISLHGPERYIRKNLW